MKSRHSIEIKALLQQKKLSKSRFNPQSSTNLTTYGGSQTKIAKRSESASTLRRKDIQLSDIQDRYRTLEDSYQNLLLETKNRMDLFKKQKDQILRYQLANDRDAKEIERLRAMLGFTKRKEAAAQTDPLLFQKQHCSKTDQQFYHYDVNDRRSPLLSKSTLINKEINSYKALTPIKRNPSRVKEQVIDVKSQFSKYKFIPTLPLK